VKWPPSGDLVNGYGYWRGRSRAGRIHSTRKKGLVRADARVEEKKTESLHVRKPHMGRRSRVEAIGKKEFGGRPALKGLRPRGGLLEHKCQKKKTAVSRREKTRPVAGLLRPTYARPALSSRARKKRRSRGGGEDFQKKKIGTRCAV